VIEAASFRGLVGLAEFGAAPADVLELGAPSPERRQGSSGLLERHFSQHPLTLRFGHSGLCEISLLRGCRASLNGVSIAWDESFLSWVVSLYSSVWGTMLTGFHDGDLSGMAVHLLPKGAWERASFGGTRFDSAAEASGA
jgi:hypothetical protein